MSRRPRALWEISKRVRMMQSAISRNEYQQAYQQFSRLTNQCIQCHQARRVWGRFPPSASR